MGKAQMSRRRFLQALGMAGAAGLRTCTASLTRADHHYCPGHAAAAPSARYAGAAKLAPHPTLSPSGRGLSRPPSP